MTVLFPTNSSKTSTTGTSNNEVFSPIALSDDVPTSQGYIKPKSPVNIVALAPFNIEDESEGQASWYHASLHLTTASIGTGILGLSKAFGYLNLITNAPGLVGCLFLSAAFVINWYTSWCLSKIHILAPSKEYPKGRRLKTFLEVGSYAWGNKVANFILTPLQLLNCVGTGIAYLIVAGNNIQSLYRLYGGSEDTKLMFFTIAAILCQLVLCLFPSLESFQGMSFVGAMMSMVYAVIAIVLCFVLYGSPVISPEPSYKISSGMDAMWNMFLGISTVAFLFGMQTIQPDVQSTLRRENPSTEVAYMRGLAGTYSVSIPLYVLIGVAGFLTFGEAVSSDILVSISDVSTGSVVKIFITIAQVTVIVHVIVAYQVWSMPVYALFESWLAKFNNKNKPQTDDKFSFSAEEVESALTVETVEAKSKFSFKLPLSPTVIAIRFAFVCFAGFVAMAIPFFGDIMALNGSIAIVPLCFICPIALRFTTGDDRGSIGLPEKVWALSIMIIMCVIAVIGGISAVRQIILDASTYELFM
ncbi:hypothetical protein SARC_08829 [Sphaeroforma arctica JP610]|uniref:Amino acid transporter transmembrane domain-containing protein n=1 Tax=Sphaeroforma arctica JP610 TaxID=667725 RepID=A0A0L0FS06_9EUKA|nr:hypothetical protein SARC_08829 [Sphaeroforma arctica JP610]KNC78748.1 hypothetical protein SARC_08829 [Sphaeroforma arctica JP610]|eukprot:XP_014152650.1 hypothetical protein SARC_08829 [Sphaeroforma arctica JP610]